MTERVIDISQTGASLRIRHKQLMLTLPEGTEHVMPLDDVGVIVSSHPQTTFSQAVLSEIIHRGGAFIVCNEKCMPAGMLLPLVTHHLQAERMAVQASARLPLKKRLWQQVVIHKIEMQSSLLKLLHGNDGGIGRMAKKVSSGDAGNIEAQVAHQYWGLLFPGTGFRRDFQADDQNRFLNYGYAVLRAIVARGLASAGLHPSLGIHHHNRYNPFCLADDIMEPMRPIVDGIVVKMMAERGPRAPIDGTAKKALIEPLQQHYRCADQHRTLFDISNHLGASLAEAFQGSKPTLHFPEI